MIKKFLFSFNFLIMLLSLLILNVWTFFAYKSWVEQKLCRGINFNKDKTYDGYVTWTIDWTKHIATVKNNKVFDYSYKWKEMDLITYLKEEPKMKYQNKYSLHQNSIYFLLINMMKKVKLLQ